MNRPSQLTQFIAQTAQSCQVLAEDGNYRINSGYGAYLILTHLPDRGWFFSAGGEGGEDLLPNAESLVAELDRRFP